MSLYPYEPSPWEERKVEVHNRVQVRTLDCETTGTVIGIDESLEYPVFVIFDGANRGSYQYKHYELVKV